MTIRSSFTFPTLSRRSLLLAALAACLCVLPVMASPEATGSSGSSGSSGAVSLLVPRPQDAPNGGYGPYLTYPEIQAKVAGWRHAHPTLVQVRSLGKTFEGRDIPLVRLSAASASANAPEVLLVAGIHPREQQPPIALTHLVDELLAGYGKDPALTRLLKERVVWVVPLFNVDGKIYDMQHGKRKSFGRFPSVGGRGCEAWHGGSDDPLPLG